MPVSRPSGYDVLDTTLCGVANPFGVISNSTLKLILIGLRQNLANPNEEISTSLTQAYEKTLKPFHPFLVRPVFYVSTFTRSAQGSGLTR
jgi:hypothetical protein